MPAVLALLLAAASLALAQSELAETALLPSASKICVENRGAFHLSFVLWDTVTNQVSARSDSCASGGQACMALGVLGEPGHPIIAVVHADGGITRNIAPVLHGAANGNEATTANFTCSGSTGAFSCGPEGEGRSNQPGAHVVPGTPASEPVRTNGICVQNMGAFLLRFRLWDTATGALSQWSGGITAPAQGSSPVCMDGSRVSGVAGGHPLVPIVSPQGTTPGSFRSVIYDPDATTQALFLCTGSNLKYDCRLLGAIRRLEVLV